jgi:beta-glucosidase/6-phospho-beta-glucosidase/beta-galactosidase
MTKIKLIAAFASVFMFISCSGNAQENTKKANSSVNKIEVIDFHSSHRCTTCKAIESGAEYTIQKYFATEVKEGKMTFLTVNVDDEKNSAMAENFEAAGTALFLNVIVNGKERHIDLTDLAFTYGNDKEQFSKELKLKLETELGKL